MVARQAKSEWLTILNQVTIAPPKKTKSAKYARNVPIGVTEAINLGALSSTEKRPGRGAASMYTSISGLPIPRRDFERHICFLVWCYLLQGVREHGNFPPNVFFRVSGLLATLASRMNSPALAPGGVRKIWESCWRRYPDALVDAHAWVHQFGSPAAFSSLTRPTRLKFQTTSILYTTPPTKARIPH